MAAASSSTTHTNVILQPTTKGATNTAASGYQLVMDPRLGVIVGTVTPATAATITTNTLQPTQPTVTVAKPSTLTTPTVVHTRRRRGGGAGAGRTSTPTPSITTPTALAQKSRQVKNITPSAPATNVRTTESPVIGGLNTAKTVAANNNVVDLTTSEEIRSAADSKEVSFNKLQGKTFPSLVVVARPHLRVKDTTGGDRSRLDAKVKAVLMHPPTKFTEW